MKPQQQAGIRCNDAIFHAFLFEECGHDVHSKEEAETVVRKICCVASRKEFETNPDAVSRWRSLDDQFMAWKALGE